MDGDGYFTCTCDPGYQGYLCESMNIGKNKNVLYSYGLLEDNQ